MIKTIYSPKLLILEFKNVWIFVSLKNRNIFMRVIVALEIRYQTI